MAARTPRRSFATPFVVTLAAAPAACYVQSSTGPTAPPPSQPTQTEAAQPTSPPQHPPVIVNPPMPQQNPPPSTTPSTPADKDMTWTVFKGNDGCMAAIKSECPPNVMCNPPPPFKYACPENVSLDSPITVATHDGGATCAIEITTKSTCPPHAICNPPRPRQVACPKR